jgi:uncharacterized protein (TIGR03086 family)
MPGMDDKPFHDFDRTTEAFERLIAGIRPDQWDDPTPCSQWNVRRLVNHVVGGTLMFISVVTGAPPPDRSLDHLGDDPAATFRACVSRLRAALADDEAYAATYTGPLGPGTGAQMLDLRVHEMVVHGWDLARATGQAMAIDDIAERSLATLRAVPIPRGEGRPFEPEREVLADAPAADRLAAYLGRAV